MESFYCWTLPVGPGEYGYLALPKRTLTEADWQQMMKILEVFKVALVIDEPEAPAEHEPYDDDSDPRP